MRGITYKKQFKQDFQAIARTGRNLERFAEAISILQQSDSLSAHFRDQTLMWEQISLGHRIRESY